VERAAGPFGRATSPPAARAGGSLIDEPLPCARRGGKLPPRTAKLAVPPEPTAPFRLKGVTGTFTVQWFNPRTGGKRGDGRRNL